MSVYRSMVRVPPEPPPTALTLADELRITSLQTPPEVDQKQLHDDLEMVIARCFKAAEENHTDHRVLVAHNKGWCGWYFDVGDRPEKSYSARDFERTASPAVMARAEVQMKALVRELRLRGVRARVNPDWMSVVEVDWRLRWWERLLGRWL